MAMLRSHQGSSRSVRTISEGDGQALDTKTGKLVPIRAQATLTVVALPKESTSNVTVVMASTSTHVLAPAKSLKRTACGRMLACSRSADGV